MNRTATLSGRPWLAAIGGLALLAGCAFSEGPAWPPESPMEQASARAQAAAVGDDTEPEARDLAGLVSGEAAPAAPGGGAALVGRARPLAVIRFGATPPDYEGALYAAVRGALQRRPSSAFDLVAVAPDAGARDALTRHGEAVFRALIGMGLPAERLSLSAVTSPRAAGEEVHLYVR